MITILAFVGVAVASYLLGKIRGFALALKLGAMLDDSGAESLFDEDFLAEQRRSAGLQ